MKYEDLKYLALPLPETVLKAKWGGHFQEAREDIAGRLAQNDLLYGMRCRLELELLNLDGMEAVYTVSKPEALAQIRERIPDFTEEDFLRLHREDKMDWIYLNGEVRYLSSFCSTLFKVYPEIWNRAEGGDKSDYHVLDEMIDGLKDGQSIGCHIHLRQELRIADGAYENGEAVRVHMPLPQEWDGIRNLNCIRFDPEPVSRSGADALQSTAYFEDRARGQTFSVEYELDHIQRYRDLSAVRLRPEDWEKLEADAKDCLGEKLPQIRFTPLLRELAAELRGDERDPLVIARRIYDYITTKTDYRFARAYANIDDLAEYGAVNRRGDCGIMALLFIVLCRINGIPAKWESGIDAKPGDVGEHDWARFYVPTVGWRYADLSYGASSYIRGAMKRWNFFFGNVDPYRVVYNRDIQEPFFPEKKFWRIDPYDNQCGEVEFSDRGLREADLLYEYVELDIHRLPDSQCD